MCERLATTIHVPTIDHPRCNVRASDELPHCRSKPSSLRRILAEGLTGLNIYQFIRHSKWRTVSFWSPRHFCRVSSFIFL